MKKILILIFLSISVHYFLFPVIALPDNETFEIKEMQRISLNLFQLFKKDMGVTGYQLFNGKQSKLPIGSTLDKKKGVFYWSPGPGFLGKYEFVFKSSLLGQEKGVSINILPKHRNFKTEKTRRNISKTSASGAPFGLMATPLDGASVSSSIAVTGWALDDEGIDSVKIYRLSGNEEVYIGDAVLVEGARPDVIVSYPTYPNNSKAGWGYMLLTNFLPNGGNGTFQIRARANDSDGNSVSLGTKTIYVDNANSVKPFGAIDTPTQGGEASGSSFMNWGWVLTPQPNSIATDGSTINVWVDGVNIGNPYYNKYRSDIASLFPGYANTDGAVGYFYLDTTPFSNGVHTIQWTARDSGDNVDGVGSRYFTVNNTLTVDWVHIPAGSFKMGDHSNEGNAEERPVHTVYLDSYSISKYEVTFAQYDAFCDDTGTEKPSDYGWGRGNRPVMNVSWNDANEYCAWISGKTGKDITLPTEAQWEYAARGTDQRWFPWGDDFPDASLCNFGGYVGKTQPVGSYPSGVSPYGVHDMAGNVYEWCSDWYDSSYYSSSPTNNPTGPSSGSYRVTRGGWLYDSLFYVRSMYRAKQAPTGKSRAVGFRLASTN